MEKSVIENVSSIAQGNIWPLVLAEGILLFITLVVLPLYAA